jgi:adenylate kinase
MLGRGRADDSEETIRSRFKVYDEQTSPLVDLYRQRGVLVTVDGEGEVEEVTERILRMLDR